MRPGSNVFVVGAVVRAGRGPEQSLILMIAGGVVIKTLVASMPSFVYTRTYTSYTLYVLCSITTDVDTF